ncbi:transglutaminase family protein [Methanoculleus sp.]|uniref:transglutaminase-like domain-containing protein n=1 Tax=Methanoculleus sp. TaxID=90427 RepID=UPI001BD5F5E2|nr:transglutaminase-like domain-containing protein [Methanoculleus sp.]
MNEKIGMRALSMLLAALLVSGTMVPAVSAETESRGWLDTFDQWVEPRDMSKYTPVIETPQRVPITEEIARQHPGVIILDPKRESEFQVIDADIVPTSPGKVSLTLQTESSDLGTRDLMPDVRMTQGTISWYWTQDTFVYHEITIHNYASSAASGMVILWSLEDGYGCGVPFSDLAAGADLTVTVPFEVLPQHSSIGVKPMAVEIRVDPTGLTSWMARMPIDAVEKYNNDASHLLDPDGGENLETSDLYHFPFSEGYRVLLEAAQAADGTTEPYQSAYEVMQRVHDIMEYNNETTYVEYIFSDLYTLDHPSPINGKYQGVCDEYGTLYTAFTRALGIPTRFLSFTMELPSGNITGHAIAESWNGNAWIHSDPTWNVFDNPQVYRTAGNTHINITVYGDADDSYYTQDPNDPTGDGILRYEDFRTQILLGEVPRYN